MQALLPINDHLDRFTARRDSDRRAGDDRHGRDREVAAHAPRQGIRERRALERDRARPGEEWTTSARAIHPWTYGRGGTRGATGRGGLMNSHGGPEMGRDLAWLLDDLAA